MASRLFVALFMISRVDSFRLHHNRTSFGVSGLIPLNVPVVIRSHRNQHLQDNNGEVKLSGNTQGWEKWVVREASNGRVTIRSHRQQNLQDSHGRVGLSGNEGGWEKWYISSADDGKVFIKSYFNQYLQDNNGQVKLSGNAQGWEKWSIILPPQPTPAPTPAPLSDDTFTLVVIPDIQFMTLENNGWARQHPRLAWPEKYYAQGNWVASNKDLLNIKAVIQVGDLVEEGCDDAHWKVFNKGWNPIHAAGLPYSFAAGNHDCDHLYGCMPRGWNCYNRQVPYFLDRVSFPAEFMSPGNYQNMITLFEASGIKFIIVSVEWNAQGDALSWARQKIEQHSDRWVIFNTHFVNASPGVLELAKSNPKTFMVTQGHDCVWEEEWHKFHQGAGKQPFIEMLIDYQCNSNGYLKYFTIDKVGGKVKGYTYNPYTQDFRRGSKYEFSFDFTF